MFDSSRRGWWLRVKALAKRKKLDRDLQDELSHHLAMREEQIRAAGVDADEARYAARRQFGNVTLARESTREMWAFGVIETLWQDLRYASRTLRNNPGFSAAAILAIALGIGINVGIFSVFNGAAMRLLPIPGANQMVDVAQTFHGKVKRNVHGEPNVFSYSEYREYRDHNRVFAGLTAYFPFLQPVTLGGASSQELYGQLASCNFFDVINEHPALGRGFVESDCGARDANAVVVVSDNLWRATFAADPGIVGKQIILNRKPFTVVGVAPAGFTGTEPIASAFWAPVTMEPSLEPRESGEEDILSDDNCGWLAFLGRVRPGVTLPQVRADLDVIAARIDRLHSERTLPTTLSVHTATFLSRPAEHTLALGIGSVILIAFGLVLLIAGANVANLLLARASARHKEIALRLSIGATRWRLVRQLLTESLLLSLVGGALGSLLAFWSFTAIVQYVLGHLPKDFPPLVFNVSPDFRVLAYALILSVLTGVIFGLVPALQASRQDLNTALKQETSGPGGTARGGGKLRSLLVGSQVAVCMILLVAAGLLMRGLYFAQTVDPGFDMKNVAVASFDLLGQGYDEKRATAFQTQLRERISALPGVEAVVEVHATPLSDSHTGTNYEIPGRPALDLVEENKVSSGYFSLLGLPLVRGRDFTEREARTDGPVAIVTESTARRIWPGEDPLGKVVREGGGQDRQVIGVVRDAQVSHLGRSDETYIYLPAGPRDQLQMQLLVRDSGTFATTMNGIQDAVHALDPQLPVKVTRLEDNLEVWRVPSRIVAALSGALGALALLLALIGVYGVVSYAVNRRIREIGIRITLGADGRAVMRLLLRQALRPVVIGAVVGVALSAGVSTVLSSVLFAISAYDPLTYICVPLFLIGVALLASYMPARRAMQVDPMVALRYE